jgi:hydroxypyruvate reductase
MATALDHALGDSLRSGMLTATVSADLSMRWRAFAATHPQPGAGSEAAGRAALDLADATAVSGGVLIVCLSGGASAMLAVPAAGLTIDDKAATTRLLLAAGVDISQTNLVRRHLSAIKGGQLAARARRSITYAISDVCTPVEDDPAVIGSGPTAPDDTTFAQALELIRSRGLEASVPAAVRRHLEAGVRGDVKGPVPTGDARLQQAAYWVIASRTDAMRAAADTALRLGYHVHVEPRPTIGEAREAPARLLALARTLPRPACLVASGETTVQVRGHGRGGRNQELAVAALEPLGDLSPAALASVGTDGVDGPTDAAGAIVDSEMWRALGGRAAERRDSALADNDSYSLLTELDALVRTGPTGTNVGDLQVLLLDTPSRSGVS